MAYMCGRCERLPKDDFMLCVVEARTRFLMRKDWF